MKEEKKVYMAPKMQVIEVKVEGNLLSASGQYGIDSATEFDDFN